MSSQADIEKRPQTEAQDVVATEGGHSPHVKRNFSRTSMLALCVSLMATWEALSSTMAAGLVSGGPVSLVYGTIVSFIGSTCSAMSLSELASAQPTAGGQYHFVARLSPESVRISASWFAGYITLLGWIAVTGSAPFLAGTQFQGLIVLNNPETYTYQRWHGTMLYWAILALSTAVCIFGSDVLPLMQKANMSLHSVLFLVILIIMCTMSPTKNSAAFVFTMFQNNTGWESDGISWCLGLLSSAYVLIGYDGATHLSEEMKNPETGIPYAMTGSVVVNGIIGFAYLIALLFCMGDIDTALNTSTGFPIIEIFNTITSSRAAATVLVTLISFMAIMATIALQTAAARVMWAFARDSGLPWSRTISRIDAKRNVPTIAILVVGFVLMLLGLINIGSTTAFNAILSLAVVGLQVSYLLPILLVLWRRIFVPQTLTWGPWRLGRAGIPVNIIASIYLSFACVFALFPPYQPVTAENMNYSSLVLGGLILLGLVYWFWRGRKQYVGPLIDTPESVYGGAVEVSSKLASGDLSR